MFLCCIWHFSVICKPSHTQRYMRGNILLTAAFLIQVLCVQEFVLNVMCTCGCPAGQHAFCKCMSTDPLQQLLQPQWCFLLWKLQRKNNLNDVSVSADRSACVGTVLPCAAIHIIFLKPHYVPNIKPQNPAVWVDGRIYLVQIKKKKVVCYAFIF